MLATSNCLLCEESEGKLHQFSTLRADTNVWTIARDLQDASLLAKLEGGDLIALEAKYHLNCLVQIRNRHRSFLRESQNSIGESSEEKKMEARAFAELVTYIESAIEEHNYFFKFSELQSLNEKHLQDFGILKEINKVCFKKQILSHFPEAQAQSDGKNIVLIFEKGNKCCSKHTTAIIRMMH